MDFIFQADQELLLYLNRSIQNSFFDAVLPLVRNKFIWFPAYIALITFILTTYSAYKAYYFIIIIIFAVTLTDFVTGNILKDLVKRERPCQVEQLANELKPKVHCSNSYSFPSTHAANHFGLAMILSFLLLGNNRKFQILLYSWAALISFAQIYVGIHYPLDILGGMLMGLALIRLYIALITPIVNKLDLLDKGGAIATT